MRQAHLGRQGMLDVEHSIVRVVGAAAEAKQVKLAQRRAAAMASQEPGGSGGTGSVDPLFHMRQRRQQQQQQEQQRLEMSRKRLAENQQASLVRHAKREWMGAHSRLAHRTTATPCTWDNGCCARHQHSRVCIATQSNMSRGGGSAT
eukprot:4639488-Prymnesium_polylepis.1